MSEEKKVEETQAEHFPKIHSVGIAQHHFVFEEKKVYTLLCPLNDSVASKYAVCKRITAEFEKAVQEEQNQIIEKAKKEAEEFEKGKKIVETTQEELDKAMKTAEIIKPSESKE